MVLSRCQVLGAVVLQLLPFGRLLVPPAGPTGAGVVALSAVLHSCFQIFGVTAAVACISGTNNEFAAHPSLKGRLNGCVSTIEAIGKLLGPLLVAPLLAALINADPLIDRGPTPANGTAATSTHTITTPSVVDLLSSGAFATFGAVTAILVLSAIAGCTLPRTVDAPSRARVDPAPSVPPGTELSATERETQRKV